MADRIALVHDSATGVEAIHARFSAHAYDAHRHDDWLVGVTEAGVQDFLCRGARQRSTPGRVILMEPGEIHDGQAGAPAGFAYSMLYLPQGWLGRHLGEGLGGIGVGAGHLGFAACLHDDPDLAGAIRVASAALFRPSERLTRDAALDRVLRALRPYLTRTGPAAAARRDSRVARRARDSLHASLVGDPGADELARTAGAADRFQLARAFRAAYGTSPHAYLVQLRLVQARRLLARGEGPAAVAAACGFSDQSHLGRRFRRAYGLTPAAYRTLCTDVPDKPAAKA